MKRIFLIVIDSCGIGAMPDAAEWGDAGCNTLLSASRARGFHTPLMGRMGLFNVDGVTCGEAEPNPIAAHARLACASRGKDTTIGHWEIAGVISPRPLPTYPQGFPEDLLAEFSRRTGRGVLCNLPYSGTEVIKDYGRQHVETGDLIVYTSADSVFQIAAHEAVVPIDTLYHYCEIARELLQGEHAVGRVIARPFEGEWPYQRTARRHDYSLAAPHNMLDELAANGFATISVGKIVDIFAGRAISESHRIRSNHEGMEKTIALADKDFEGLCFTNLVDTDMVFGHRRDVQGYGDALTHFDEQLTELVSKLREDDLLLITADHGCDPGYKGTDHTREYVPLLFYGSSVRPLNLGTRPTFADIAATVLDYFGLQPLSGDSLLPLVAK